MKPRELFDAAEALFLDFDGPIAALMPPPKNEEAAAAARRAIHKIDLPIEIATTTDHLGVLGWAMLNCPDEVLVSVEAACTSVELHAARSCDESLDAAALFDYASSRQIPIAIVSNNAADAVRCFLERRGWQDRVTSLACRTTRTIELLKPNPGLLFNAAEALNVNPSSALFVGDSVSDVRAGLQALVPVLGISKDQSRHRELLAAGAHTVVNRGSLSQTLG